MQNITHQTKIVATMGPASANKETLKAMISAGLNVCRINFSHGTLQDHQKIIDIIRSLNKELKTNVGILADLQGPKIRIGLVKDGGIVLTNNNFINITTNECVGDESQIYISYLQIPWDVKPNEIILLDDGKIQLKVISTNKKDLVKCQVIHGGLLTSRKGVNLPNTRVSIPSLTEEDLTNLDFALKNEIDWIGLSFVRSAIDVDFLKHIISNKGKSAKVVAKIEKPEAVENIDEIIALSDAVMVARGDLGVEIPMENVPLVQKLIINKCRAAAKPVIVATQMIESMITSPRPTRAEVNDVANSVLDGADAVMVSGETSVGEFPVDVIQTLTKIIGNVETHGYQYYRTSDHEPVALKDLNKALCTSAVALAKSTGARAIAVMTQTGLSALELSKHRPKSKIYVFTGNRSLLNAFSLVWGVKAFFYDKLESTDQSMADVNRILKKAGLIKSGDVTINTAAAPLIERGKTNLLKVSVLD